MNEFFQDKYKIVVIIPWRETPERLPAFVKVNRFYKENFSKIPVHFSDSNSLKFNRSSACNRGIVNAINKGYDIAIINDADCLPQKRSLLSAIELSYQTSQIVVPYNEYHEYGKNDLEKFFVDYKSDLIPCSGTVVIPLSLFRENQIGFFEEELDAWGPEDQFFHKQYIDKIGKPFASIPGILVSMYTSDTVRGPNPKFAKFYEELKAYKESLFSKKH